MNSYKENKFYIAKEGTKLNVCSQKAIISYCEIKIELKREITTQHGDGIYSGGLSLLDRNLPFWLYGRNLEFLGDDYLLADTVMIGTQKPIATVLIVEYYNR